MHQLLLIDQNTQLSKVVKLNLVKAYDFNVIEKPNLTEALDLLEIIPNISMIIVRDENDEGKTINDLFNFLMSNERELPMIVIGKGKYVYKKAVAVESEVTWQPLVDLTGKILGLDNVAEFSQSQSDYVPVPANYFLSVDESNFGCDVYIRVKKGDEYQYIKRLNSVDSFMRVEVERYMKSGLKEFYLPKEQFPAFVNFITDKLIEKVAKVETSKDKLEAVSNAYNLTAERIETIGIDQKTIDLALISVKSMQSSLGEKNALADFLNLMMQNKLSYNYAHSFLISLLMYKILKQFDWDSPSVKEKVSFIAFFHDISLQHDGLFQIDSMEELNRRVELSNEQKISVLQHAYKSAAIVEQFTNVPMGIGALIREHHGVKSGNGFTTSWSNTISPLAAVFIVVEFFASEFLRIQGVPSKAQLDEILEKMSKIFEKGTYSQAVQALQNTISKK